MSHALSTTPLCSHASLISGMCGYGRDNSMTDHTSQYKTLCTAKSLFTLASPGNTHIEWLWCCCPQSSPTAKSSSQEHLPPSVEGADFLSHASSTYNSRVLSLGQIPLKKGHVSCALFSPIDLTQRSECLA
jgi:hypothetical protein